MKKNLKNKFWKEENIKKLVCKKIIKINLKNFPKKNFKKKISKKNFKKKLKKKIKKKLKKKRFSKKKISKKNFQKKWWFFVTDKQTDTHHNIYIIKSIILEKWKPWKPSVSYHKQHQHPPEYQDHQTGTAINTRTCAHDVIFVILMVSMLATITIHGKKMLITTLTFIIINKSDHCLTFSVKSHSLSRTLLRLDWSNPGMWRST